MKKFSVVLSLTFFLTLAFFCGCESRDSLTPFVSDLRSEVYTSEENSPYKIKATYGFKENPYVKDGIKGETETALTFRIENFPLDSVTRTATVEYRNKTYSCAFGLDRAEGFYSASLIITDFTEKKFTLGFFEGAEKTDIVMTSVIPENALSAKKTLEKLKDSSPSLIKSYYAKDGRFDAEITARILVKNDNPYWYIAITDKSGKTKAFLTDAKTGELLAVREIF